MSINESALNGSRKEKPPIDYNKIVRSSSFQQLMHEKRLFIVPWSIFFLVFYFTLPILTAYSTVLNQTAFGSISWAWIFGAAQFVMTWTLCVIYSKRAAKFDQTVESIKQDVDREGGAILE